MNTEPIFFQKDISVRETRISEVRTMQPSSIPPGDLQIYYTTRVEHHCPHFLWNRNDGITKRYFFQYTAPPARSTTHERIENKEK